jgi:hypothetical protein
VSQAEGINFGQFTQCIKVIEVELAFCDQVPQVTSDTSADLSMKAIALIRNSRHRLP